MKTMAISEFKTHALKVLNEVARSQETIITKRGKPIAQVAPHRNPEMKPKPGKLADAFIFEKDIITPLGEGSWEANEVPSRYTYLDLVEYAPSKFAAIITKDQRITNYQHVQTIW